MKPLYIISTPIGNLGDISLRALEILRHSDLILCEDTRTTNHLLAKFDIHKPLVILTDHNDLERVNQVRTYLEQDKVVALVSENGTPLISDPGYKLVRELIKSDFSVESIPGASSPIAALTVSGLAPDKFLFVGFLPKKERALATFFQNLISQWALMRFTLIAFESPYRIKETIDILANQIPDCYVAIARELTKVHEEVIRGTPQQLQTRLEKKTIKGEVILLINPQNPFERSTTDPADSDQS